MAKEMQEGKLNPNEGKLKALQAAMAKIEKDFGTISVENRGINRWRGSVNRKWIRRRITWPGISIFDKISVIGLLLILGCVSIIILTWVRSGFLK